MLLPLAVSCGATGNPCRDASSGTQRDLGLAAGNTALDRLEAWGTSGTKAFT